MAVPEGIELKQGEKVVDLLDGGWAVLRNPDRVPERKRRPLVDIAVGAQGVREELRDISNAVAGRAVEEIGEDEIPTPSSETLDLMSGLVDSLIVAMVASWSYGPEVTVDVLLDDVAGADYDTLRDATAPYFNDLLPDFSAKAGIEVTPEGEHKIDWQSPTVPSSA